MSRDTSDGLLQQSYSFMVLGFEIEASERRRIYPDLLRTTNLSFGQFDLPRL